MCGVPGVEEEVTSAPGAAYPGCDDSDLKRSFTGDSNGLLGTDGSIV